MVPRPDSGGSHQHDPPQYCCPISDEIMEDPVVLVQTGHTYDRKSIQAWFARGESTCPVTGEQLSSIQLAPNYALKGMIQAWRDSQPTVSDAPQEQNGSTHYPVLQGGMYPSLAVDGRPQDKLAQVQSALVKFRGPSLGMRAYREQCRYELWTLSELMLDPYCCTEMLSQGGLPPVLKFLSADNAAGCQAGAARIVQRLVATPQGPEVYGMVAESDGIVSLVGILGVSESAKSGELSCREAAALALRDLAATGKVAQDEIFFQLCARAKQIQGGHKGQPTFIAPLQLLFHAPADSEAEAAAALIVQLTHKMPLQEYGPYSSCIGTAAIQSLTDLLGGPEAAGKQALLALLYTSNQASIVHELVQKLADADREGREAAGMLLWEAASGNANLVGVINQVTALAGALEAALRARSLVGAGIVQMMTCDHPGLTNSVVAPPNTDAVRMQLVSHEQVIPSLVQLLFSDDHVTAQAAVHALANLTAFRSGTHAPESKFPLRRTSSNTSHHPSAMVAESLAVPRLMSLLSCPNAAIVAPSVALLNNLCAENDTRDKVREAARQWGSDRLKQRLEELMAWSLLPDKCRTALRTVLQRLGHKLERAPAQYNYITLLMRPPTQLAGK